MKRSCGTMLVLAAAVLAVGIASAPASPPAFDHVVVVIEENHSFSSIMGNLADAPYINQIAAGGTSFTNFFAITHPSEPNYLQFFSGSNQLITDDSLPGGLPFASLNLGAGVRAAGFSFAGYSESIGTLNTGSITYDGSAPGGYARKHNPWVNWMNDVNPSPNQLPSSTNLDFASFSSNFTQLPNLSFVVPTLYHDMHDDNDPNDGVSRVRSADDWLKNNLKPYIDWASDSGNKSLFVLTFDEDERQSGNRIPTVFFGANVRPGATNNTTWTLHNLQRTIEDVFGSAHSGSAANVRPIVGAFTTDGPAVTRSFRNGDANNYQGTTDTYIRQDAPGVSLGAGTILLVDADIDNNSGNGKQVTQALIRFDNIFGAAANQIPPGSTILSAKLILNTGSASNDVSGDSMSLHRMLVNWNGAVTWGGGFGGDGVTLGTEAETAAIFALIPNVNDSGITSAIFDVTSTLQDWSDGVNTNYGWLIHGPTLGQDGWVSESSEFSVTSLRPTLEITIVPEPLGIFPLAMVWMLGSARRRNASAFRSSAAR